MSLPVTNSSTHPGLLEQSPANPLSSLTAQEFIRIRDIVSAETSFTSTSALYRWDWKSRANARSSPTTLGPVRGPSAEPE